jgi:hypothetical protein
LIGNQWAQIAKEIIGRTENQVKNRFNSMLKKIREEKTFRQNMRGDIRSALEGIHETKVRDDAEELEDLWLNELIQRKNNEVKLEAEQEASNNHPQEEQKRPQIEPRQNKNNSIK